MAGSFECSGTISYSYPLEGRGSLWLFGVVTVPAHILKSPFQKKAAQSIVSNHP